MPPDYVTFGKKWVPEGGLYIFLGRRTEENCWVKVRAFKGSEMLKRARPGSKGPGLIL